MRKSGHPTKEELQDLVARIRRVVEPQRILLFGSLARGTYSEDSDIDVLVQLPDAMWPEINRINMQLYVEMAGFGRPVDILVATGGQMIEHKDTPGFVYQEVARYGRPIYEAAA